MAAYVPRVYGLVVCAEALASEIEAAEQPFAALPWEDEE
jgi:hypothetical protein